MYSLIKFIFFFLLVSCGGEIDILNPVPFPQEDAGEKDAGVPIPDNVKIFTWFTPITEDSIGQPVDSIIEGHTLDQIINNEVTIYPGNTPCKDCHNDGRGPYGLRFETPIEGIEWFWDGYDNGYHWSDQSILNWAQRYVEEPTKGEMLKVIFQRWIDDGYAWCFNVINFRCQDRF